MSWRHRIRELILAGGVFGLGACGTSPGGVGGSAGGAGGNPPGPPCGNANPDPCICGRPDADPTAARECDEEIACDSAGGVWDLDSNSPVCVPYHAGPRDGATADGGSDAPDAGDDSMNGSD